MLRGTGLRVLLAEARAAVHHGPQAVQTVVATVVVAARRVGGVGGVVQQRTEVVQREGIAATLKNRQL